MGRRWRILEAAVEQKILFPSTEEMERYINSLKEKGEPYEIIGKERGKDGPIVIMRKAYNNNRFFGVNQNK